MYLCYLIPMRFLASMIYVRAKAAQLHTATSLVHVHMHCSCCCLHRHFKQSCCVARVNDVAMVCRCWITSTRTTVTACVPTAPLPVRFCRSQQLHDVMTTTCFSNLFCVAWNWLRCPLNNFILFFFHYIIFAFFFFFVVFHTNVVVKSKLLFYVR